MLTAQRNAATARRFFGKTMQHNNAPDTVAMDKSGANKAALDDLKAERKISINVRQVKYFTNIIGQDHRAIKRVTRRMPGFTSFRAAQAVLAGIELAHMIRKGQLMMHGCESMSFVDQFYTVAGPIRPQ